MGFNQIQIQIPSPPPPPPPDRGEGGHVPSSPLSLVHCLFVLLLPLKCSPVNEAGEAKRTSHISTLVHNRGYDEPI